MNDIIVRKIREEDIEQCALIYVDVFSREPWFETHTVEAVKRYLKFCIESELFFGYSAIQNGSVCGMLICFIKPSPAGNILYVDELCIDLCHQHMGIGSLFINEIEKYSMENGVIAILAHTDKEAKAFSFYEKHGYVSNTGVVALSKNM